MTLTLKKTKTELLTKDVERRVAYAISVFMGDTEPNSRDWLPEAKTVVSAYVIGQKPVVAAQRLLTWHCVDMGMPEEDLCELSKEDAEPFLRQAIAGYFFLVGVDK